MSTRISALDAVVFGVDIQSGDIRGDAPSYAVVAFDGEHLDRDVVSYRKLRRLIEREEPAIVATDNVYEFAEDKDHLVRFLGSLPDETKLVQVTGAEQPEPLSRVANRHGVPYGKKPMKEAEAAARLAAANVGYEVSAFTDTTEVKVSRGRSTGKGGWSADRFTRRIHGSVKRRAREVESALKDAGLDYSMDETEKYGGYSNAVFTVEARPSDIPVSRNRSGDTRIEIQRVRRDGIEFEPLAKRRDHVVVGIDPGTTTGVAIVGLDGEVLDVLSTRTADTAAVTEWIIERGRPVVVAADVERMPSTVEKIRRSFSAAGWVPETDIPVDEKKHRARETGYDNDHERDSLAAALFAFDDYEETFDRITRRTPPRIEAGEVIARVVAREESLEAVLSDLTTDESGDDDEPEHEPRELTPEERRIKRLETRVERLDEHVAELDDEIDGKDETIAGLEADLSDVRREERQEARERREVNRLERENNRLEDELDAQREATEEIEAKLDRLKELWRLDHSNFADVAAERQGLVPVKPVAKFTKSGLEAADEQWELAPGDVCYLRDASGAGRSTAEVLAEREPRVVLLDGGLSEAAREVLFDHEIPTAPADEVTIEELDDLAVARENEVEAAIEGWRERAEDRRKDENESMVDQLISEHRADSESLRASNDSSGQRPREERGEEV